MLKAVYLILLLLPAACAGQSTIAGKVINLADKKPIANASVFLSNATVGTATAADGTFTLGNVRQGQYDLVVSVVGYETYHQNILVNAAALTLPPIKLITKITALREVSITPDRDWDRYYQIFKRSFIGVSDNAAKCLITNPDLIDFDYNKDTHVLNANTGGFLIIQNKALGYRIRYLLSKYINDPNEGLVYFEGSVLFEEMDSSPSQHQRWEKKRLDAYLGSAMHFLRSALSNQVTEQGFKVLRLIRKPNPDFGHGSYNRYLDTLVNIPLGINDYIKRTDQKGLYALQYKDCLFISYLKKRDAANAALTDQLRMPDFISTVMSISKPYALFDKNGIILNPQSVTFQGSWTNNLVAELLPVDYEPVTK